MGICTTFVYGIKMVSGAHFYLSKCVYVQMELYIFFYVYVHNILYKYVKFVHYRTDLYIYV